MKTDRLLQETVARCVSTIVYYFKSENTRAMAQRMAAEVRMIADSVGELGLGKSDVEEYVTRPLEAELVGRYGDELGGRLFGDFIATFEGNSSRRKPRGGVGVGLQERHLGGMGARPDRAAQQM